jgi:REP element-mobilizing transposase RayT
MANTYSQIYLQFVFAVKYRESCIHSTWKDELYKYISGIIRNNGHTSIIINGMPDHIHLFVGFHSKQSISAFMQDVKGASSKWINEKKFTKRKFVWQEGYGVFSYGRSQIQNVVDYIENQEKHHSKKSFRDEYIDFLKKFEIVFEEKYTFSDPV